MKCDEESCPRWLYMRQVTAVERFVVKMTYLFLSSCDTRMRLILLDCDPRAQTNSLRYICPPDDYSIFGTRTSKTSTRPSTSCINEPIMVVYRINETLQTGAVTNRTYRAGETVYLFLKFTINFVWGVTKGFSVVGIDHTLIIGDFGYREINGGHAAE